jgi:hypothetical protein
MELKVVVERSWYLRSADCEMFNQTDYNYGFAFPEEIEVVFDGNDLPLSESLADGLVKEEPISIPEDIDFDEDYLEERIYSNNIPSSDITFYWFNTSSGDKVYIYDQIKSGDKYIHLYLDE